MIERLSSPSISPPILTVLLVNGVSKPTESYPQVIPAAARKMKPSPSVSMTTANCGWPITRRKMKASRA